MKKAIERSSNIELLRIIAMMMIVAHHFVYYGVQQNYNPNISGEILANGTMFNKIMSLSLLPGGVVGVAIFFLIAGYFGINSDSIHLNKIVIPTCIYSILGLLVVLILGCTNIYSFSGNKEILKNSISSIFPVGNEVYWFITVYVILILMKPGINKIIRSLKYRGLVFTIIFLACEYMVARQVLSPIFAIIEASLFYIIGAFMSIYKDKLIVIKKDYFMIIFIIGWIGYVVFTNIHFIGTKVIGICLFGGISAIGLFEYCTRLNMKNNYIINSFAILTFDVYLLHEFPLLREFIWRKMLKVDILFENKLFPIIALIAILLLYLILTIEAAILRKIAITPILDRWNKVRKRMIL